MRKNGIALAAAGLYALCSLTGCVTEKNFMRPNTSPEQLHQDYGDCGSLSDARFPVKMEIVEPAHWTEPKTHCLISSATKQEECETDPPVFVPDKYADVNLGPRVGALKECMGDRGYTYRFIPG